jgi:hypothetical protein
LQLYGDQWNTARFGFAEKGFALRILPVDFDDYESDDFSVPDFLFARNNICNNGIYYFV